MLKKPCVLALEYVFSIYVTMLFKFHDFHNLIFVCSEVHNYIVILILLGYGLLVYNLNVHITNQNFTHGGYFIC